MMSAFGLEKYPSYGHKQYEVGADYEEEGGEALGPACPQAENEPHTETPCPS